MIFLFRVLKIKPLSYLDGKFCKLVKLFTVIDRNVFLFFLVASMKLNLENAQDNKGLKKEEKRQKI